MFSAFWYARFGIFKTHINIQLDNIKDVVMASCALHNFLRRISPDTYTPSECFDIEDLENGSYSRFKKSPIKHGNTEKGK
jgi:hypothetical protein